MKRKQTLRSFVYLTIGLAMMFYALPNMPDVTMSLAGAFTVSWLAFALLMISANLYYLIGVDREQRASRERIAWLRSRMRQWNGRGQQAKTGSTQANRRRYMN